MMTEWNGDMPRNGGGSRGGDTVRNGGMAAMLNRHTMRRWLPQLIVLILSLSLVTGVGVTATLRSRWRREHDGAGWSVPPLAIAHRGDDSAPENSLHAIDNAGARGVDYAEIDVRLTADGVPVVFHDNLTGRLSRDGVNVPVSSLPESELRHMVMRQHGENYHVPTLDQAIMSAQRSSKHLGLLLDLKTGPKGAPALTRAVMERIERRRFVNRVMVMSVTDRAVVLTHRRHPEWLVGKCVSPAGHPTVTWPKGASFVVMRGDRVTPAVLKQAKRDHVPVYAGVGGNYREANRCLKMGAVGVLGASARRVLKVVERHAIHVPHESISLDQYRSRNIH